MQPFLPPSPPRHSLSISLSLHTEHQRLSTACWVRVRQSRGRGHSRSGSTFGGVRKRRGGFDQSLGGWEES
eukprot:3912959-Rhodomonas_salina.1